MAVKTPVFNVSPQVHEARMTKKRPKPLPVVLLLLFFSVLMVIFGKAPVNRIPVFIPFGMQTVK
jgi:hypothetical protein